MSTVIYPSPIFGPVISRRLGVSLGINLMPADGKICTFDCIYCECGLNAQRRPTQKRPSTIEVAEALEAKLKEMSAEGRLPDVLTFAGNGEPTLHPDFPAIIDAVTALRDRYCPQAKVSVLSNATRTGVKEVREALMKVDNNIQKLDTISPDYIRRINQPTGHYDVAEVIEYVKNSPYFQMVSLNFHTPFEGTEHLALSLQKRNEVIDLIISYKKKGYPIMNSVTGLNHMRDLKFKKACWMSSFIFADGTRSDVCAGEAAGVCDKCGFCMAGEERAVMDLAPDTIKAGMNLRVK